MILQSIERKCWNSRWLWLDNIKNQFCSLVSKGSFTKCASLTGSDNDIINSRKFSWVIEEIKIFLIPHPLFITILVKCMLFFNLYNSKSWHLKSMSNFFLCLSPRKKKTTTLWKGKPGDVRELISDKWRRSVIHKGDCPWLIEDSVLILSD